MKTCKRVLSIQDISCVGQCSLTVALPILSACGLETCILPSAVLSTHTGGEFKGFTFRDLSDDMPGIAAHWLKQGIRFDAFYSGYLGNVKQIRYVRDIFDTLGNPGALRIVDPVMADFGRLYTGFDDAFVDAIRPLVCEADYILPNITEACLLTGTPYRETYGPDYISGLVKALHAAGAKAIILTGVSYDPEHTGVLVSQNGVQQYYMHKRIEKSCHGTGDVFASVFTGTLLRGKDLFESARTAADFTLRCIENTIDDPAHWYGVKFEPLLGLLTA